MWFALADTELLYHSQPGITKQVIECAFVYYTEFIYTSSGFI